MTVHYEDFVNDVGRVFSDLTSFLNLTPGALSNNALEKISMRKNIEKDSRRNLKRCSKYDLDVRAGEITDKIRGI